MSHPRSASYTRRQFLETASVLGAGSLLGLSPIASAEPPPETKKIRLIHAPTICFAPQLFAEDLLRLEGFSEIEYVDLKVNTPSNEIASGRADMSMTAAPEIVAALDETEAMLVVGGVHAGCYELFGNERVQTVHQLKGRRVVVSALGSAEHIYISSIVAYLGMDPRKDLHWIVAKSSADAMQMFIDNKVDAFLGFPPQPQDLRLQKVGHVIIDTSKDRPWSQYFCCMVAANKQFVSKHPIATKRALRAMLKGADMCATDPERVAKYLVARNYESRYEVALEVLKELPYRRWREANPEDTIRFHALRLHEVGMIKSNARQLIARGTDWRFFNELKKELKA
jgi:NitT/TauT family transport system substrate-binding protein